LVLAIYAAIDIKPQLQRDKFQWDVVLHDAPAPRPSASEATPAPKSAADPAPPQSLPQMTHQPAKSSNRRMVERTAIVQTVQAVQATPRVVERSAPQEREAVITKAQSMDAQAIQQEAVVRTQQVVQQEIYETVHRPAESIVTAQSPEAVMHEVATPTESQTAEVQQPSMVEKTVVKTDERMTTAAVMSSSERNDPIEMEPAVVHREAVEHRALREAAPAQADFGWLSESLWNRIEQLKRYPVQARARRWEGKVVLEAVIRHDGTILDCLVAESSGHGLLDQDAMAVLRRASPLALKHPLGKEQITILVPIAYRLGS
jgi:protein TonB